MFPPIEFSFLYSETDKKLYTFLIHTVMREFEHALAPFVAFRAHPISKVIVKPDPIVGCNCIGLTEFYKDEIKLQLPTSPGYFDARSAGNLIAHECGHHILEEYFGKTREARIFGNNLIHRWANSPTGYGYPRLYGSKIFGRKYLLPLVRVNYPDLKKLIADHAIIQGEIEHNVAPRGANPYW